MTRDQIAFCGSLVNAHESLSEWADRFDPDRERESVTARSLDQAINCIGEAFLSFTGRSILEVGDLGTIEFNTELPSEPWASLEAREEVKVPFYPAGS